MQLLRHGRFGVPAEVLELVSEPVPAPGAGQVLVRIEAAPIHAGDLVNIAGGRLMYRGVRDSRSLRVPLPQVPGIEGVGRVVARGPGVLAPGLHRLVYLPRQCGSWRTHLVADAAAVTPLPEGDPAQLCLMVNAFTAEFALSDIVPLAAGEWFLQNGANSNVGRNLIRLARRRGIRTINVVRRPEVVAELQAIGADVVVLDGPGLAARVRAVVGDAPLRIALDGIAGGAAGRLAECLSDGATLANFGTMSGEDCCVPTWLLLYKRLRVVGYYAGFSLDARPAAERTRIIRELAALVVDGTLATPIAARYPLSRFREAVVHAAHSGSARNGKIIFSMSA